MSSKVRAIVDDGMLRLLEPLDIPKGRLVEVSVEVSTMNAGTTEEDEVLAFERALDAIQEAAAEHSEEWWDEFQQELAANRLCIPERR